MGHGEGRNRPGDLKFKVCVGGGGTNKTLARRFKAVLSVCSQNLVKVMGDSSKLSRKRGRETPEPTTIHAIWARRGGKTSSVEEQKAGAFFTLHVAF